MFFNRLNGKRQIETVGNQKTICTKSVSSKMTPFVIVGWTLIITIARAIRLPNDYSEGHLLKKTGNLRQVQKQLGHASPATTANMYADISFEDMRNGITGLYH